MKTILDLVILNLIQIILTVATICLLASCAVDPHSPLWMRSLETLPQVEGFSRAGIFTINGRVYVQLCGVGGNQVWMRYNEKTHAWSQSRYNTLGCVDGENSTGPDAG